MRHIDFEHDPEELEQAAVLENEKKPGRGVRNLYEWVDALVTSLITVIILFTFIFRVVSVSGPSMIPTLYSEDRVVLWSYFYQPKQGDVVVITHTAKLTEPIIKRIIAVEGQEIDIDFNSGTVYVDGQALDESAYIQNGITTQPSDFTFPMEIPEGKVFVMGDNRAVSNDSRSADVGLIDKRYILGKAEFIVFPFDRIGKIN